MKTFKDYFFSQNNDTVKTFANQKILIVKRTGTLKNYTKFNNDSLAQMLWELTPSEFTVLVYLLTKIPNTEYALSPKDLSSRMNLAAKTISDRIIPSLIKKNYITNIKGNRYLVTDVPCKNLKEILL